MTALYTFLLKCGKICRFFFSRLKSQLTLYFRAECQCTWPAKLGADVESSGHCEKPYLCVWTRMAGLFFNILLKALSESQVWRWSWCELICSWGQQHVRAYYFANYRKVHWIKPWWTPWLTTGWTSWSYSWRMAWACRNGWPYPDWRNFTIL